MHYLAKLVVMADDIVKAQEICERFLKNQSHMGKLTDYIPADPKDFANADNHTEFSGVFHQETKDRLVKEMTELDHSFDVYFISGKKEPEKLMQAIRDMRADMKESISCAEASFRMFLPITKGCAKMYNHGETEFDWKKAETYADERVNAIPLGQIVVSIGNIMQGSFSITTPYQMYDGDTWRPVSTSLTNPEDYIIMYYDCTC